MPPENHASPGRRRKLTRRARAVIVNFVSRTGQNMQKVRKAVLPAAGLGTRFLPATKAQPKEMLPVVDKPLIQYTVEECVASGIENIIIVTGRGKNAIEDHFDSAPELERFLEDHGQSERAELVRQISKMVHFSYTRQREPLGLGHAVLAARELVGDEPFAVLLGDVIINGQPVTRSLMDIYEETGIGAIAVEPVPRERLRLYGVVDTESAPAQRWEDKVQRIRDLVEKPAPEEAPSNLGVTGRYVLPPVIFDYLASTEPGRGGEIQLTDALRQLARKEGLYSYTFEGKSYDAGDKLGFLKATVELAMENQEFGDEFRAYLKTVPL
jgi:UTP--glucose-1-phosphate uridylyltransferase